MSKADSALAAVVALMAMGATAGAVARSCAVCYDPLSVVEVLEGDAKEEREVEREVRAQDEGEGEAIDVVETDNADIGADTKE